MAGKALPRVVGQRRNGSTRHAPHSGVLRQSATSSTPMARWGRRSVRTMALATRRSGWVTVIPARTVQSTLLASREMTCL